MFDKAYLCIPSDPQIDDKNNQFSFDGGWKHPIFGGANCYKIKAGHHKVQIISGNGDQWTVEADVKYDQLLTIKVELAGKDICDVMYKVGSAPAAMGWCAMKLD